LIFGVKFSPCVHFCNIHCSIFFLLTVIAVFLLRVLDLRRTDETTSTLSICDLKNFSNSIIIILLFFQVGTNHCGVQCGTAQYLKVTRCKKCGCGEACGQTLFSGAIREQHWCARNLSTSHSTRFPGVRGRDSTKELQFQRVWESCARKLRCTKRTKNCQQGFYLLSRSCRAAPLLLSCSSRSRLAYEMWMNEFGCQCFQPHQSNCQGKNVNQLVGCRLQPLTHMPGTFSYKELALR